MDTEIPHGLVRMTIQGFLKEAGKHTSGNNVELVYRRLDAFTQDAIKAAIRELGCNLEIAPRVVRPLDRTVSEQELTQIMTNILAADPTIADDRYNGAIFAQVFLSNATSPRKDANDIRKALQICGPKFKRNAPPAPPEPPPFPDEDLSVPLADGSDKLPIDANHQQQRGATRLQSMNLLKRLRLKEQWEAEQQIQ